MGALKYIAMLLQTGLGNLAAYLAAHVLLCLLPAFFIAGALTALVPKEAITRFLGRRASKWVSYPAALLAGSVLAVCSCTILPLFAGIRKRGAGLGPALTFMFFAPASNILAIMFTGVKIGMDIALARILLCMVFGVAIGLIMSWLFRKEEEAQAANDDAAFASGVRDAGSHLAVLRAIGRRFDRRHAAGQTADGCPSLHLRSPLPGPGSSSPGSTGSCRRMRRSVLKG